MPLAALSWVFEGRDAMVHALAHLTPLAVGSAVFTAWLASLLGYGLWNTLLARYPAGSVVPFTMLVPVVGMLAAWAALREVPTWLEIAGGALLLAGVATSVRRRRPASEPCEPSAPSDACRGVDVRDGDRRPDSDGRQLAPLAFSGYAHYTSMQVRAGRVVGLDLHLDRLTTSAQELFGVAPARDRLRSLLRHALRHGDGDASAQMTLFTADGSALLSGAAVEPSVLVRTSPLVSWAAPPMRVRSVPFERFLPHVKNADALGLTLHVRQARSDGYDDVVFTTPTGEMSKGSIWNVALQAPDGTVVWPSAPSLPGITQRLVQQGLDQLGVA